MPRLPSSVAKPISQIEFLNALYKSLGFPIRSDVPTDEARHVRLGQLISSMRLTE